MHADVCRCKEVEASAAGYGEDDEARVVTKESDTDTAGRASRAEFKFSRMGNRRS